MSVKSMIAASMMVLAAGSTQARDIYESSQPIVNNGTAYDILMDKAYNQGTVRVIIKLRNGFQPQGQLASAQAIKERQAVITQRQEDVLYTMQFHNMTNIKRFKHIPYLAMEVDAFALEDLHALSAVAEVIEDFTLEATLADSIPLVGADRAWLDGYSGEGQTVAILDTGVDKTHSFLAGKVVAEACFSTTTADGASSSVCPNGQGQQIGEGAGVDCSAHGCEHGTHVAGIAAGEEGVAKDADIIAVQVFSQDNSEHSCALKGYPAPCITAYGSDILKGLEFVYELRNEFDIASVNLSLGGGKYTGICDPIDGMAPFKEIFDNLRSSNIASVVASGNEGHKDGISFPACLSNTVSVGATDKSDVVAGFSNSADFLDLLAPGVTISSSVPGNGFAALRGTSMAAPHVAGAWAVLKNLKPTASVDEVLSALVNTGKSVTDYLNNISKLRIQVDAALEVLAGNGDGDNGNVAPLTLLEPTETITETLPTYKWSPKSGSDWYYIWLQDHAGDLVANGYLPPANVGCGSGTGTCAIRFNLPLALGQNYTWWIAAGNLSGYEWSEGISFTVNGQ